MGQRGGVSDAMLNELTAKQRKALYVRVGFKGDDASFRNLPRFRLTAANINRIFNCDVEFLQEEATGGIVWPKAWQAECLPLPYQYNISEKVWPELDPDALEADEYRGKVLVVADNVPEEVTAVALVAWLNAGLDDDDPDVASGKARLAELKESLVRVDKQIKELPAMKAAGVDAKKEAEQKKKRAQALGLQRVDLQEDIRAITAKFEQLKIERESMQDTAFNVRLVETRMPLRLNVWEVRFAKDRKGQRLAYVAAHKYNWAEFRLAVHKFIAGRVITGKLELPDWTGEFQEVNMRNVTVSRRRHGVGMYRFRDERGFYSGHFRHGLRHGTGTEVNVQGRFQGRFARDWRAGPGTQVFANGDTYRGPYGGSRFHDRESLIFGDEYADGLQHGAGRMRFVDGSLFDGEFRDGLPAGRGRYVSAAGTVTEGVFGEWCSLHGYGSHTADDVTRIGGWRHGLLHGNGTEIDMRLGRYTGEWLRGEKHGPGRTASRVAGGVHEGHYKYGFRCGHGAFNWGNVDRDALARAAATAKIRAAMRARGARVGLGEGDEGEGEGGEGEGGGEGGGGGGGGPGGDDDLDDDAAGEADGVSLPPTGKRGGARPPNEYLAAAGELPRIIPYRGDFSFEGRFRAGAVRQGGVVTSRFGRPETNLHVRHVAPNVSARRAPALAELVEVENAVARERAAAAKATFKDVLDKRLVKEAENLSSFNYWRAAAAGAMREFRRTTRAGKTQLEEVKAAILKPESKATGGYFDDDDDDGFEEEADEDEAPVKDAPE